MKEFEQTKCAASPMVAEITGMTPGLATSVPARLVNYSSDHAVLAMEKWFMYYIERVRRKL